MDIGHQPQKIVCLHAAILVTGTDDGYVQFTHRENILFVKIASQHIGKNYSTSKQHVLMEIQYLSSYTQLLIIVDIDMA